MLKRLLRIPVILFCCWHIAAIGIYAMPWKATDRYTPVIRTALNKILSPYTLLLSQWQQWDLFSPDPLRRVTWYTVQRQVGEQWVDVEVFGAGNKPWWRNATYAKMWIGIFEQEQDTYRAQIANRAVQSVCEERSLQAGTVLRLLYDGYVIGQPQTHFPTRADWQRYPFHSEGLLTACPSA